MHVSKKGPAPTKNEQLVPISQTTTGQHVVDARSLHKRLGIQTPFYLWIKRRIKECGFLPEEYITTYKIVGGGRQEDYEVSIDMAKELAMLEKNEIGRKFRKYFIEAEKQLRQVRMYAQVSSLTELKKRMETIKVNGREMYPMMRVREALGYSTKGSSANVKRCNAGLVVVLANRCYISEEYVKYMISLSTTRKLRVEAKQAEPVLSLNFGDTSNLPLI